MGATQYLALAPLSSCGMALTALAPTCRMVFVTVNVVKI